MNCKDSGTCLACSVSEASIMLAIIIIDTVFFCEDEIILANNMNLCAHFFANLVSTLYENALLCGVSCGKNGRGWC